ncbi:MAG: hypothetical protein QMD80_04560 [archaeon]|nr:hypothetical protein [archaeon]
MKEKKEHPLEKYMDEKDKEWFRHYMEKKDIMRAQGKLLRAHWKKISRDC